MKLISAIVTAGVVAGSVLIQPSSRAQLRYFPDPGSGGRNSQQGTCRGYSGIGGPCYSGLGGPLYNGPGGPCYSGIGGPCYSGIGGTGVGCSRDCPY